MNFYLIVFVILFILWKREYDDENSGKYEGIALEIVINKRKLKGLDPIFKPINKALFGGKKKA